MIARSCCIVLCALVALAAQSQADAPAPPRVLRVLTYNIHHAEGTDGKLDLERIAKVIQSVTPDLVALQEVDRKTRRTRMVDQAAELGKLTGMHVEFARAIDFQDGAYGLATLSRFPIQAAKVHSLPGKKDQESRIVHETRIAPGGAFPAITFLNTHFQHDDGGTRAEQAARVNELFGKSDGVFILAGDLNDLPDSPPMRTLFQVWTAATPADANLRTIPADAPRRQIDYILYWPGNRLVTVEAKVIPEKVASDHRPVLAVLRPGGK